MVIYFLKKNTAEYVIYPEPEDKSLYFCIDVDDNVNLDVKRLVDKDGEMILVDAPENDAYTWNGKKWTITKANQTALLAQHQSALITQLANKTDQLKSSLLVGYPQAEIDSFYRQEKEALAYQADNSAETPMLKQIAELRGVPFEILVQKVIEKSNQFALVIGAIIGQRQKFEDRILSATSETDLDTIKTEVNQWQLQNQN